METFTEIDNEMEIDPLDALVDIIEDSTIDPKTKNTYMSKNVVFIMWLMENQPELVPNTLMEDVFNRFGTLDIPENATEQVIAKAVTKQKKLISEYLKEHCKHAPRDPPIAFAELTSRMRLAEFKFLMKTIDNLVSQHNLGDISNSLDVINRNYDAAIPFLGIPGTTPENRERRVRNLMWRSVVDIIKRSRPSNRTRTRRS